MIGDRLILSPGFPYDGRTSASLTAIGGGLPSSSYGYDVQDNLTSVTDAEGNISRYTYSDRHLMTEEAYSFLATGASCGACPDCSQTGCGCTTRSYNAHARLEHETDPRGVTVSRIHDALDRVTLVNYSDNTLDIGYTYDDLAVMYSKGRLTEITRDWTSVAYRYDLFGRVTQDGTFHFDYDDNGNPTVITSPNLYGSLVANYTYDFADREYSLSISVEGKPNQTLVSQASYKAFGPLTQTKFGNNLLTVSHAFNERYELDHITVTGASSSLLDWDYMVDSVGNPTDIVDLVTPANSRSFNYQDYQYFLACAAGPWNPPGATCSPPGGQPLSWTYDKIGNRHTETRNGVTSTYTYATNGSGYTPRLSSTGGIGYTYGDRGDLTQIFGLSSALSLAYNDEGRLRHVEAKQVVDLTYDGRGFLRNAMQPPDRPELRWTDLNYTSDGLLRRWARSSVNSLGVDSLDTSVFYFAGRPVARLEQSDFGSSTLFYVVTDHLGTSILETLDTGAVAWQGGFEPFGADYNGAATAGIELRLPGQLADDRWGFGGLYYNVHRWYQPTLGRYTRPDPYFDWPTIQTYGYVDQNPLSLTDADGLFPWPGRLLPKYTPACIAGSALRAVTGIVGTKGPRWAHCIASCEIAKCSGEPTAYVVGISKELFDTATCLTLKKLGTKVRLSRVGSFLRKKHCDSAFQPSDFQDNRQGISCPKDQTCDERCKDLEGQKDAPPGPLGDPSL